MKAAIILIILLLLAGCSLYVREPHQSPFEEGIEEANETLPICDRRMDITPGGRVTNTNLPCRLGNQ